MSSIQKHIVLGAGGHAIEVLEILLRDFDINVVSFFDNTGKYTSGQNIFHKRGVVYASQRDFKKFKVFSLGLGGINARKTMSSLACSSGLEWRGIRSKKSNISKHNTNIHRTVDLMDYTIVSPDVNIGRGSLINRCSSIHHDVKIGDFCELAPNTLLLGSVKLGNNVFVGAKAVIKEKVKVCDNVIIGMGAVVIDDINEPGTYIGIPARAISKR
jgi:sugar O-acyltransferase (sialic acid O-acetyltransferase NeuD family)